MDPRPYTFGELQGMLEAYEFSAWDHTASLLACVVGLVKKGVEVKDYHPYRKAQERQVSVRQSLQSLKGLLPKFEDRSDV